MKKIIVLSVVFSVVIHVSDASCQNIFKFGPSMLVNITDYQESSNAIAGVELSYEIGIKDDYSLNLVGGFHFGKHKSRHIDNRILGNKQEDRVISFQADFRYHFRERYNGGYLGLGFDVKSLHARYYFAPSTSDPVPTLDDFEKNIGVSLGYYHPVRYGVLNPNFYFGVDPSGINAYSAHARLGINYGF